ncbi:MAG TPA: hypothetical protein VK430_03760 [Xanthobacteraceae bacterium]|nr:hypothetical protein [Xanthobacteraceae bacterium]
MALYVAEAALEPLLTRSIFNLRTSVWPGQALLQAIRQTKARFAATADKTQAISYADMFPVSNAMATFEAVFGAELALMPLYVVTPKAGFDTSILIEAGARCFPDDVWTKVPEAISDLSFGAKCIAFELFTAAGFHLHRANEAVLRRYWDAVTKGEPRPQSRNMGDYLNEMNQKKVGDDKVKAALKDLKDLHRNPLIHPEHSLETADEAIALMNGVHTVMVYMLKEIPATAALPAVTLPGAVAPPSPTASSGSQP